MFDADSAVEKAKGGPVILVRYETTPDDIHGMIAAQGILTVHGGMTSHAAVVARGMGKPCVAGCEGLSLERWRRAPRRPRAARRRRDHDRRRHAATSTSARSSSSRRSSTTTSRRSSAGPTASGASRSAPTATTPTDAVRAREFGAQGIGLCRTEHMFFGEERLPVMQEMILAESESGRRAALERLLPFQQADFDGIFEAMARAAGDDPPARPAAARVPAARGAG